MRILVTGATGFFGAGIVTRLREAGHSVVGASRGSSESAETRWLDVSSAQSCADAFRAPGEFDAVVHAAALAHVRLSSDAARLCHSVNVVGTEQLLSAAAAAQVRKFIFISSIMVYGDVDLPDIVTEDYVGHAEGTYARAKLLGEKAANSWDRAMSVYVMRMATMYSADWLVNLRKRVRPLSGARPMYILVDPLTPRYSFCSRENGAEAVLWAVEDRVPPGTYNVADDTEYCQSDVLEVVRHADGEGPLVRLPAALPRVAWRYARRLIPTPRLRAKAGNLYWKFCERNVFSAAKLAAHGFVAPGHMIAPPRVAGVNDFRRT